MDFRKYICPVCNKNFNEDDDIAVCPECGTPHHKECYLKNGKCFNEHIHGTENSVAETYTVAVADDGEPQKNEESVKNSTEENNILKTFEQLPDFLKGNPSQDALIGGKHAYLYEIAVDKNREYYIPRFMLMDNVKKGFSWNFFAFLTPFAWTLYRKMYKFSALVLAIYMLIFGLTGYYILSNEEFVKLNTECAQEDPEYLTNIASYTSTSGNVVLTAKQQELLNVMNELTVPTYVTVVSGVLLFAIRVYLGLFANKRYMEKLKKNIDKAEKKGLRGDDLKRYLYKKYGTVPMFLAIIIGGFELFSLYL